MLLRKWRLFCGMQKTQWRSINEDFCGHQSNPGGIDVGFTLEGQPIIGSRVQEGGASSLAVSFQNNGDPIAWIGMTKGQVLKVCLHDMTCMIH